MDRSRSPGRPEDTGELGVGRTALPGAIGGPAIDPKSEGGGFPRGVFRIPELAAGPVQCGGLATVPEGRGSFGGLGGDQADGFGG